MKRKVLALLLGVTMVASSLSGCGSKEKETEKVTEKATEAVTEAATEKATEEITEAATEAETEEATEVETETEVVTEAAATEAVATEAVTEAAETEEVTEEVTEAAETEEVTEEVTEAAETEEVTEEATEAAETEEVTEEATEAVETEKETEEATEAAETEEATEEATEAAETEEATEEVTEAETEEVTEEATEAETEEATEVVTEVETETEVITEAAATEEAMEEATEMETEEVTEKATEAETEEVTEEVTEAATEEVTEEATEAETEEVTEKATEAETEEATEAEEIEYKVVLADDAVTGTVEDMEIEDTDIVVLYNNDVHGGISADEDYSGSDKSLGYAGMAAVKDDVMSRAGQVTTVDLGDAIQGSVVTTESDGQDAMNLMTKIGYDICIPGNHEFDYGMETFLDYADASDADFLSCNFIDLESGESVFDGYKVVTYDVNGMEFNVGYVGISTPETIAKSTPTYFQDEDGNFIYGFDADTPEDLYEAVQTAVDEAIAEGADCIVGLGHLGDAGVESDWSSISVVANTTGIDVMLDGHSHSTIPGEVITNKDGEDVVLSSTGTKLENIGVLKLSVDEDGNVTAGTGLVNELTEEEKASDAYTEMEEMVTEIEEQYAYLFEVVGSVDYDLVIYDPADGGETRLIRTNETNMGDFLTDVYRNYFKTDVAFMNGGSIRANISAGDITYMDLITVYPWNTEVGVIEVTGQQILDCLEMGAHLYPEECGGFIQASGLTYTINTTIPSSVNVNSDGEFVSVDGDYRVENVLIGEEPLDLKKTYTLAINRYYSEECGDGMTMFKGSKMLQPAEGEEWEVDHDVVIAYLDSLGGKIGDEYADPYGQGRISYLTDEVETATEKQPDASGKKSDEKAEKETEAATEELTEEVTEVLEALTEAETEAATEETAATENKAVETATEEATEAVTE